MATQYKIVLVGDGRVGKTTWVKKLSEGYFDTKYVATLGVEVSPIKVNTNRGEMTFNIWNCAGQDKYGGFRDGYYKLSTGAIVMFDSTNQESMEHVDKWRNDVNRVCNTDGHFPVVVVASKCDQEVFPQGTIGISTKYNFNLLTPLLELARQITEDPQLRFIVNNN